VICDARMQWAEDQLHFPPMLQALHARAKGFSRYPNLCHSYWDLSWGKGRIEGREGVNICHVADEYNNSLVSVRF